MTTLATSQGVAQPGNKVLYDLQSKSRHGNTRQYFNRLVSSFKLPLTREFVERCAGHDYAAIAFPPQSSRRRSNKTKTIGSHAHRTKLHLISIHDWLTRSLDDYIQVNTSPDFEYIRHVGVDLIRALQQLEIHGYVHLDLKPDNIMLDSNGKLWLIDFDNVSKVVNGHQLATPSKCHLPFGNKNFIAPDVVKMSKTNEFTEILSQHPWAVGLQLFYLVVGGHPFEDNDGLVSEKDMLDMRDELAAIEGDAIQLCAVIVGLLQVNPSERMTLNDALQNLLPDVDSMSSTSSSLTPSMSSPPSPSIPSNSAPPLSMSSTLPSSISSPLLSSIHSESPTSPFIPDKSVHGRP
jgi:serine/threonine protein kinase